MLEIKPFKAYRPTQEKASEIAALPYDVFTKEEAREYVQDKPLSFLNIDRPETQFDKDHDMYSQDVYEKANDMIQDYIDKGLFIQDDYPRYYIYELTMNRKSQTGIVALSSIDDYLNDICKKHENTVEVKELDRINHVDITSMQTGPIFLAYKHDDALNRIIHKQKQKAPLYDFISEDEVGHRVWMIDDKDIVKDISRRFKSVKYSYIADGHHRAASAVKAALKRREKYPDYTGEEEFNGFLSILFPDNELRILDYNRFVEDLNGFTKEEFLDKLSSVCKITPYRLHHPGRKGHIMMCLDGDWYRLSIKPEVMDKRTFPDKRLDVSVLQEEVLSPILGIKDPRVDPRITFIGGIKGVTYLQNMVLNKKGSVAFAMYPTSINELFAVADASLLMPPKSTWFEPKPRSGLFLHEIER